MAQIKIIEKKEVTVEINKKDALIALAEELGVYCYLIKSRDHYYVVKDNILYIYEDTSQHGSPLFKERFVTGNNLIISNYQLIKNLAGLNNIDLDK